MQQQLTIKLLPSEASSEDTIKQYISQYLSIKKSSVTGYTLLKRSLDARGRQPMYLLTLNTFIDEPFIHRKISKLNLTNVSRSTKKIIIAGAGPAGLFAALTLIEKGIKPVILERGKDVRSRRRDLASLNKEGIINPDSNYCFGEGGAGTYSDGKLYTRSTKRGDVYRILNILVQFGADENILSDAHPHIGTNKLPQIITSIRKAITDCGGEFLFEKKITDLVTENNKLTNVITADGDKYDGDALILATGHSARDIFLLLHKKNILIEAKPFALGVRVEHPQQLIDSIQYHCPARGEFLPPASYSLVQQTGDRGVFSFCMCPGGIIAPASTAAGELVVNGWSPSKRNNPFANSGIVAAVNEVDFSHLTSKFGALAAMELQSQTEKKAFKYGGGNFVAPAQRLVDFTNKKLSSTLPECSYVPGIHAAPINEILPSFIYTALSAAFKEFGKKMKGYFTNDAIVVATESRTSSPVRIPRNNDTLEHPQIKGLYPCGEGAGYAGGIVSAAMDGERVANMIAQRISVLHHS
ncbi:MAG: FAD-dependent monooxygenase [Chitinophagaceae bacterium]|nr:FAD-dependent monooxygenase [Chitinophagaceae bacterium]